jgi:Fe-S-cluster containining protein
MSLNFVEGEVPLMDDGPALIFYPYEPEEPASPCADCFGACCRKDMVLELSKKEARMMIDGGTDMYELPKSEWQHQTTRFRTKFWRFAGNCAFLDPDTYECRNYDNRPQVCREFKAGAIACEAVKTEQASRLGIDIEIIAEAA